MTSISLSSLDPFVLVDDDYALAELTILFTSGDAGNRLFFGIVEMLPQPCEAAPPVATESPFVCGDGRCSMSIRRWTLAPSLAVAWYRSWLTGANVVEGGESANVSSGPLEEEPPWPSVILEQDAVWEHAPFWGHRTAGSRRHHLVRLGGPDLFDGWSSVDRNACSQWLRQHLPVDPLTRPLLWGSMSLILPNPIFREVNERLTETDDRKLSVFIVPLPGRSVRGLKMALRQYRSGGFSDEHSFVVDSSLFHVNMSIPSYSLETEISCPKRGVLYHSGPHLFLKQISINFGLSEAQRTVEVPSPSKGREKEIYTVSKARYDVVSAGKPEPASGVVAITLDLQEQEKKRHALEYGQRWFSGNVDDATKFLRDLIGKATTRVLCVDPYFGFTELMRFALATVRLHIPVQILAAGTALRIRTGESTRAAQLHETIKAVTSQDPDLRLEVRVARGKKSPFHDRFLAIDEDLWILGSSFNEFGSRGTMAVRVPFAPAVMEKIEELWAAATPLSNFLADIEANQ